MNEAKAFRAWDEKRKIWHYDDIFLSHDGILWYRKNNKELVKVDWEVCFSIGFSDKEGALIYEGDILEFSEKDSRDESFYLPVVFDSPKFVCQSHSGRMEIDEFLFWGAGKRTIKIIGNIYQNPNLKK